MKTSGYRKLLSLELEMKLCPYTLRELTLDKKFGKKIKEKWAGLKKFYICFSLIFKIIAKVSFLEGKMITVMSSSNFSYYCLLQVFACGFCKILRTF